MREILSKEEFYFISEKNKAFIVAFDEEMKKIGYDAGDQIGEGYCWGKYMIIYRKAGVKSKKSFARIYIRDSWIALRFYFSNINAHRDYIEQSSNYIQEAFINGHGSCSHCHNQKEDGSCGHRKSYVLHERKYEKCDGFTFEFWNVNQSELPDYIALFQKFNPVKKQRKPA